MRTAFRTIVHVLITDAAVAQRFPHFSSLEREANATDQYQAVGLGALSAQW